MTDDTRMWMCALNALACTGLQVGTYVAVDLLLFGCESGMLMTRNADDTRMWMCASVYCHLITRDADDTCMLTCTDDSTRMYR